MHKAGVWKGRITGPGGPVQACCKGRNPETAPGFPGQRAQRVLVHPCLVKTDGIWHGKSRRSASTCREATPYLVQEYRARAGPERMGRPRQAWPAGLSPLSCEDLTARAPVQDYPLAALHKMGVASSLPGGLGAKRQVPAGCSTALHGSSRCGRMHHRLRLPGQAALRCPTHCSMASLSPINVPFTNSCGTVWALASAPSAR